MENLCPPYFAVNFKLLYKIKSGGGGGEGEEIGILAFRLALQLTGFVCVFV